MRDYVCVIPARLGSTRLPKKPLINVAGKPMIRRTFERAISVFEEKNVYIATDSKEVATVCLQFTNNVVFTSKTCLTGTDRVAELSRQIDSNIYINLQGDEPIMPLCNLEAVLKAGRQDPQKIFNGFAKITSQEDFFSPMVPKVVFDECKNLIYMSRSSIPGNKNQELKVAFKQICVYSFPKLVLEDFMSWGTKGYFEEIEDIEILRFLEKGIDVKMLEMDPNTIAVDTPDDLRRLKLVLETQGENIATYSI